jgi:hypothetical protein
VSLQRRIYSCHVQTRIQCWSETLKERGHIKDQGIECRITLKELKKLVVLSKKLNSAVSGYGLLAAPTNTVNPF